VLQELDEDYGSVLDRMLEAVGLPPFLVGICGMVEESAPGSVIAIERAT
jgi:hypothetical protein